MIFASRGGVGVADKAAGETAAPALPGRPCDLTRETAIAIT